MSEAPHAEGSAAQGRNAGGAAWDVALAILAGAIALAVFVRSLAPGLLWGDSAEFQFAAYLGGFVHPTGYPLYLMLGWLWSHLVPFGDPAYRMNLFSAVWGGIAVACASLALMVLLRFVALRRGYLASRLIGFFTALVFAFTPTFWSQAVIAEVYTMHAAFVASILLSLFVWAVHWTAGNGVRARRWWYAAALLFGLSLAHHRSTILLAPAIALFLGVVWAGGVRRTAQAGSGTPGAGRTGEAGAGNKRPSVVVTIALIVAPLLLYLYIPLRAPLVPYYRLNLGAGQSLPLYDASLRGFIDHVSGSVFGGSLAAPVAAGRSLVNAAGMLADEASVSGVILGLLGLGWLAWQGVRGRLGALAALLLTSAIFLAQVVFNLFYGIGDIYVFYIPAYLVWALWIGVGGLALAEGIGWMIRGLSNGPGRDWIGPVVVSVVLVALAAQSLLTKWPRVQRASDNSARVAWEGLLESEPPEGTVLVSNDRDEMAPLWYLKYVEGCRPDLDGVFPLIRPGPEWADVGAVTEQALQTGRPVALVKPMPGLEVKFALGEATGRRSGALGPLSPVVGAYEAQPSQKTTAVYGDAVRLSGFDVDRAGSSLDVTLWWETLRPLTENWTTFVQVFDRQGNKLGQSDHPAGGEYYGARQWKVGDVLRDAHPISLAPDAPPGPYRLVVGLYVSEAGSLRHLGEPQSVGEAPDE